MQQILMDFVLIEFLLALFQLTQQLLLLRDVLNEYVNLYTSFGYFLWRHVRRTKRSLLISRKSLMHKTIVYIPYK